MFTVEVSRQYWGEQKCVAIFINFMSERPPITEQKNSKLLPLQGLIFSVFNIIFFSSELNDFEKRDLNNKKNIFCFEENIYYKCLDGIASCFCCRILHFCKYKTKQKLPTPCKYQRGLQSQGRICCKLLPLQG